MSAGSVAGRSTVSLTVVAWIGALTALFGALVAVAQNDIKRILAYSTVSQLGYMMVGLATGGVAVGMFHLITHAFFKALLFLGAGSVIHGCHEEQDIRRMGGLRKEMPVTFCNVFARRYAGAERLSYLLLWFLEQGCDHRRGSLTEPISKGPFVLLIIGALLTAFYMMRQVAYVFFGNWRGPDHTHAHESPRVMTLPLAILAVFAIGLGVLGTPAWPWFTSFIESKPLLVDMQGFSEPGLLPLMGSAATMLVFARAWRRLVSSICAQSCPREACRPLQSHHHAQEHGDEPQHRPGDMADVLESSAPVVWKLAGRSRLYFDELYAATVLRGYAALARLFGLAGPPVSGAGIVAAVSGGISRPGLDEQRTSIRNGSMEPLTRVAKSW